MARLSIEGANLIGSFLSAVLFGLYTSLFVLALTYIASRCAGSRVFPALLVAIWLLTFATTACRISGLCSAFKQEITDPLVFEETLQRKLAAITTTLQFTSAFLSDCLICWRLYIVWNYCLKVIAIPVMLLLGMTISGLVVVALCFVAKGEGVLVVKGFDRWLMAASIFTVGVNLVVTILLCWRIWCIGKEIPIKMRKASRRYRAIIHALIESGGVYSAAVAIQAIVNVAGMKSAAIILSYVMPQMVGLAPTWIVIRLHSLSSQQSFTTKSHC